MELAEKITAIHGALAQGSLPHAFGGALALAWCTGRARGTIDIDVNVFVGVEQAQQVLRALPNEVTCPSGTLSRLRREGQVRLWWQHTPVDVFLNSTGYHQEVAQRIRWERFAGQSVPFISCHDLAVFKAFFNRTKHWADLEEMVEAATIDTAEVSAVLIRLLGADDERVTRLLGLGA